MGKQSSPPSQSVFRLVAAWGDQTFRWALDSGDYVLGSAPGCDLRLRHPSISRRHAAIRIRCEEGQTEAEVEDLKSRNGTRVEGQRIYKADVSVGQNLRFGSVDAFFETVEAADLEAAVTFARPEARPHPKPIESPNPAQTTLVASWFESFVFEHLPKLMARAASRPSPGRLARHLGAALFAGLPCLGVEITGQDRGLVFTAGTFSADADQASVVRRQYAGHEIRLALDRPDAGVAYGKVLDLVSPVLSLATKTESAPTTTHESPALPEPPTLSPELRSIYQQATKIAPGDIGVLIRGESGTGKELLARYLHEGSGRRQLVELNCAALPQDLLEAELFGVERGAATGVEERAGMLETAHDGTLFLDEIGDMALATQAKILRALQERKIYRLGGHQARPAEARIIAATNRPLDEMLEQGTFRRDLYHRIADWEAELPPLRHRRMDVPNLAAHFLERACRRRGVDCRGLSRAAVDRLAEFDWPGNVRQLEREMSRAACFLDDGELLETQHLRHEILAGPAAQQDTLKSRIDRFERREIQQALRSCDGDVRLAATRLGLGRSSLYRRLKKLGIEPS